MFALKDLFSGKSKKTTQKSRLRLQLESLEERVVLTADSVDPVLMVISNQDFWYSDYADTRTAIEDSGLEVEVASTSTGWAQPHGNSGQGADGGFVQPDLALTDVEAEDYSAIVFVGGWGSATYQYGFEGTYHNAAYNGSRDLRQTTNDLINDFLDQDKHVAAICYGVSVLAYARVDGTSLLDGRTVAGYHGYAPASDTGGRNTESQLAANNAVLFAENSLGDPAKPSDDVHVDGQIITGQDWRSALLFGSVVADEVFKNYTSDQPEVDPGGAEEPMPAEEPSEPEPVDEPQPVDGPEPVAEEPVEEEPIQEPVDDSEPTLQPEPTGDSNPVLQPPLGDGGPTIQPDDDPEEGPTLQPPQEGELNILPVLMVIANQDFYYQEYNDTRISLVAAGLDVVVAATEVNLSTPHWNSGQGEDGGYVMPDIALVDASAEDYSAIVFVGGWGSSQYQYAYEGTYGNANYNGDPETKTIVNELINDFWGQGKYVTAICHAVNVLAYARVEGDPFLEGVTVSGYAGNAPDEIIDGGYIQNTSRHHLESNGAIMVESGSVGDPTTVADDVIVEGKIITAENYDTAAYFGQVVAQHITA